MSEPLNQQSTVNPGDGPAANANAQVPPLIQPGRCVFEPACSAFKRGLEDASKAAEKALPKIRTAAADAAYWLAYGIGFAAGFNWTVARKLTPTLVKDACRHGVSKGCDAGERLVQRMREARTQPATQPPPVLDPGTDTAGA